MNTDRLMPEVQRAVRYFLPFVAGWAGANIDEGKVDFYAGGIACVLCLAVSLVWSWKRDNKGEGK